MKEYYYINVEGAECGPVSLRDLMKLRQEGEIPDSTWVWESGQVDWVPLVSLFPQPALATPQSTVLPSVIEERRENRTTGFGRNVRPVRSRMVSGLVASFLLLVALICVTLDPSVQHALIQAFGEESFSLPTPWAARLVLLFLLSPCPWFGQHFFLLTSQASRDAFRPIRFAFLRSLFTLQHRTPRLLRSQKIAVFGFFYLLSGLIAGIIFLKMHQP
jgi:hypothetical protein